MKISNFIGGCLGVCLVLAPFSRAAALVTSKDLATGAVTTPKLANSAVTASKLGLRAVTAPKIAALAVTADKIAYYRNVIIVAPSGGDFTSPVAAMNSIGNAADTNRYLVKLMPGVYDIGAGTVLMKPWVDIEGSGEGVTIITGTVSTPFGDADPGPLYGVVTCSDDAELRFLTVQNTGQASGPTFVAAILARDSSAHLTHVSAIAQGTNLNAGVILYRGTGDDNAVLQNIEGSAHGGVYSAGIIVRGGTPAIMVAAIMVAAIMDSIGSGSGAASGNVGMYFWNASPWVLAGAAMGDGAASYAVDTLGASPTLVGVTLLGALRVKDNAANTAAAAFHNGVAGQVSVDNGKLDLANSSLAGQATLLNGGTARCAAAVNTEDFTLLEGDCQSRLF